MIMTIILWIVIIILLVGLLFINRSRLYSNKELTKAREYITAYQKEAFESVAKISELERRIRNICKSIDKTNKLNIELSNKNLILHNEVIDLKSGLDKQVEVNNQVLDLNDKFIKSNEELSTKMNNLRALNKANDTLIKNQDNLINEFRKAEEKLLKETSRLIKELEGKSKPAIVLNPGKQRRKLSNKAQVKLLLDDKTTPFKNDLIQDKGANKTI